MEVGEIIKLIVDNGVAVGILIYLCVVNYRFMTKIDNTLAINTQTLELIKNYFIEKMEDKNNGV